MIPLLSILMLGFLLGIRHATDADHVVAIGTIVSRERTLRGAAQLGALWGAGHTVTILAVGGAIILLGIVIPPRIGLTMEFAVAAMLILLGSLNVSRSARDSDGGHTHEGDALPLFDRRPGRRAAYQVLRPLVVGVVHGLAGSAAVALLVLGSLHDPRWATAYLLVFSAGTIAGMMLITVTLAMPLTVAARRFSGMNRYLALSSGLLSLAFGLFLVYRIGFVDGLFTGHPSWTPG
jgi:high-affinity nickel-transport protein